MVGLESHMLGQLTKKGQDYHRLRIFGVHIINETAVDSWISYQNGTIIDHLAISGNSDVLGDFRVGFEAFDALLSEQVYLVISSSNHRNGAIKGYFRCRPHTGLAFLNAGQVVSGSNSTAVGLGWAAIDVSSILSLPQDVLAQDASIDANSKFTGRILHNATNTSSVTFNGPATSSQTAPALATAALSTGGNTAVFSNITVTPDFYSIDTTESYYLVTASAGNIRGQILPLLTASHRRIPVSVDTVAGSTALPGAGLSTLRYANQEGSERNANSYITFNAQANPTNFTYIGVIYFNAATNKKNFELVRALTVEMNGRISGTGTWLFEFFDATTGEFIPAATWSIANNWTPAYIDYWQYSVHDFANSRQQLVMRVSVNSASATSLSLDLMGVRSWTPSSGSNFFLKGSVKLLNTFRGVFANGTVINA